MRTEKANASEPLMKCRKRSDGIKTGRKSLTRDEPGGYLLTAQAVSGIKVARARSRLLCGTREPAITMRRSTGYYLAGRERENPKSLERQGAEYRCRSQGRTAS